jgi:hypothetical protein
MAIQVVRPENRKEFMSKLIGPAYAPSEGTVQKPFSEPTKLGQPEQNRAYEISERKDGDKDFTIGIKDVDEALMYYFNNHLKLSVVQNNTKLTVPVIYGTPENWKSVQRDGYYRDQNEKLMAPLLMFKRSSVTQNRDLGYKLDGNQAHNVQLFKKAFSKRNIYSNFGVLNNRVPETKYVVSATPDYVTVEYECIVWTYFVEQMDKLIESLNFASRSYWGDPNRFLFYSSIESFQDSITYDIGDNRAVRTNFTITLNGYLIPDTLNRKLAAPPNAYGISRVIFGLETIDGDIKAGQKIKTPNGKSLASTIAADGINKIITQNITIPIDAEISAYILNNTQLVATYVSPTEVTFNKGWAIAPSPLPANSLANFIFFVNGVYVEPSSIVSFINNDISSTLIIDPTLLGYSFESTDLIVGIGKFNQS